VEAAEPNPPPTDSGSPKNTLFGSQFGLVSQQRESQREKQKAFSGEKHKKIKITGNRPFAHTPTAV
jgi:hypothetical protein